VFKRKSAGQLLRVFFVTDVHGSDQCFVKFINAAAAYKANVLILGGDITGKRVVPIVPNGNGDYVATMGSGEIHLSSADEIRGFEKEAANAGLYAFKATPDDVSQLDSDPQAVERYFLRFARTRVEQWLALAEERLAGSGVRLIINCGNDDPFELDELLRSSAIAVFPEGRTVEIDDRRSLISVGFANQTPWQCPRDTTEEDLARRISEAVDGAGNGDRELLFSLHCPPYDSGLDMAPRLTEDMSTVMAGGQPVLAPVGSTAVRAAIEEYQPLASLHGHIHEGRGVTKIGRTLVVNPGSEYPDGMLRGALIDLNDNGIKGYVLTSG
jgi:Icc-related predicted phosphoesterase